ncbi:MAG: type II toxin-antitoxin system RelE/ParE family toxin [Thermoplasmata archaeon]|nr:type II toxin-antitoxin system RelE/ParE family toxin [Thermoplasmata archaeon]
MRKLERGDREAILHSIERILEKPHKGSLLVYSNEKCLKWRTGSYRIVYKVEEKEKKVILLVVAHRKKVYK